MNRHRWVLLGLGAVILVSLGAIATLGDLGERVGPMLLFWGAAHLGYLAAAWLVMRRHPSELPIVLAVGLLARILLLPTAPTLSEDVYRYLWDGRLVALGVNPYPHAPSDPALSRFQDERIHHLNHADVPTIYPPAAQLLFGAVAFVSATPAAWKLVLLALELLLVLALLRLLRRRGLPKDHLLLYYWNPLVLVESFGSGHVDLVAAVFLVATIALYEGHRRVLAGVAFALAVLTKFVPALFLPWLLRRRAWALLAAAALTAAILAAPFLEAGPSLTTGLRIYARHWEFNGALYRALRGVLDSDLLVRQILACLGVAAVLVVASRARSASGAVLASLTAFLLISPTVFPWYAIPAVALLPLHPDWGMFVFSGLLALSYVPLSAYRETGVWSLPGWILWVEYGGLIAAWVAAACLRSRARVDEREHAHVEKSEEIQNEKR